jgi:hypothetical protein
MDIFKNQGGNSTGLISSKCEHGQAALLLIESLMHALVAKGSLTREEFVDVVEGAAEVEIELRSGGALTPHDNDSSLLQPLADAFRIELGR